MATSSDTTGADRDHPAGPAPKANGSTDGPNMTNGIPDGQEAQAIGTPNSDREQSELAGNGDSGGTA